MEEGFVVVALMANRLWGNTKLKWKALRVPKMINIALFVCMEKTSSIHTTHLDDIARNTLYACSSVMLAEEWLTTWYNTKSEIEFKI